MNRQNILNTAEQIFGNVIQINEDLYRAELKPTNKKPAGVYYLDLNENIPFDQFEDYQDKLLAKDYYEKPGDIQWNYYLLLLQDKNSVADEVRFKIEKNDRYARKYIFDEEQFKDFFTITKTSGEINSNIVNEIKAKLDEAGLSEIYGHKFYTTTLENFINNNVVVLPAQDASESTAEDQVKFINSITLTDNYRSYPKDRHFTFRRVNLVKGINGVGKTSLFEAIELSVCGKTFRNSLLREVDGCVEVTFNHGEIVEKCMPSDYERYRKRDFSWYASYYPKDNFLFESFNRFNFFNADAAQNFAKSNNEDEIKKALFNIVLGSEFNHITDRIKGFYERFRPVLNQFISEFKKEEANLKEANETILNGVPSNSIESISQSIIEAHKKLAFYDNIAAKDNISEIESLNNALLTCLNKLKDFAQYGLLSKKDITQAVNKTAFYNERLLNFQSLLKELNSQKQDDQNAIEVISGNISLLQSAANYFNDSRLFQLKGLSKRLKELNAEIDLLNWAQAQLQGIQLEDFNLQVSIKEYNDDLEETKDQLNRVIRETREKIDNTLSGQQQKERLVAEIKMLGKNFIALDPAAASCPMCNTQFDRSILKQKIETLVNNQDQVAQAYLDSLNNTIIQTNKELDAILKTKTAFETIKNIYNNFNPPAVDQIQTLVAFCKSLNATNQKKAEEKQELMRLSELSSIYNASENEFAVIEEKISKLFPRLSFVFENKQRFEETMIDLEQQLKIKNDNLDLIEKRQSAIISDLRKDLELPKEEQFTISQLQTRLKSEENNLKTATSFVNELQNLIRLPDDVLFESLSFQAEVLSGHFRTLREEQQIQFYLNEARKKKENAEKFLRENRNTKERYVKASDTLQQLMSNDGDEQLKRFFKQNMDEIIDIFKNIHTPREFSDLVFQDNQLAVIPVQGQPRRVSQISTGQRSALALSIFIAMNRKLKQGPNVIMFDDPVAFIDDLNALSFLDYLRFFVLKENRQIFFATANARLAELFEKKFSFLEEEFEKWSLTR